MRAAILKLDYAIAYRTARAKPPRWFRILLISLTRAGDAWLWIALGLLTILEGGSTGMQAFKSAAVAVSISICLFLAIKRVLRRSRPDPATWHRLKPIDSFSCPSGHAMTAFTVASALLFWFPQYSAHLLVCAGVVAVSRVLTSQHFLTDVVIGGILGSGIGYGVSVILS